jgi:putative membrane protein
VGEGDQEMMEDIAHANLAEISTGKMALEKGQSDAVKKMAQKMIDDHTRAQEELEKLASSKGVKLPTETDVQHKTMATALEGLSGKAFDEQYIKRVGVGDHQRTHDLLKKVSTQAKDPQLKAYAAKTIKGVDSHLAMAKKMQGAKDSGK